MLRLAYGHLRKRRDERGQAMGHDVIASLVYRDMPVMRSYRERVVLHVDGLRGLHPRSQSCTMHGCEFTFTRGWKDSPSVLEAEKGTNTPQAKFERLINAFCSYLRRSDQDATIRLWERQREFRVPADGRSALRSCL